MPENTPQLLAQAWEQNWFNMNRRGVARSVYTHEFGPGWGVIHRVLLNPPRSPRR